MSDKRTLKAIKNAYKDLEHFYIDAEQFLYLFEMKNQGAIQDNIIQ